MRIGREVFKSPFFWLILMLVGMELTASRILPYAKQPKASQVYRNPTPHRGWPEYLKGRKIPDKKLVIIISNSQGVGWENTSPSSLYAARLQKAFQDFNIPVVIENWSNGGITTPDIELLTIKALERKPDLVVFILGYNNFDFSSTLNLDYSPSDINLLAGDPQSWPYLKSTTFFKNTNFDDIARRFLLLYSSLARSRIAVYDIIAERIPIEQHKYIFGHEREPLIRLDEALKRYFKTRPLPKAMHIMDFKNLALPPLPKEKMQARLDTFNKFYPFLNKRFSRNNIRFIWVWMPVATEVFPQASKQVMAVFERQTGAMIKKSCVKYLDFTYAIPGKYFYMLNHLDEEGHDIFSKILLPVIKDGVQ